MRRVFLIGPPGAGKTACGQTLASKLHCPFFDTDQLIEQSQGKSICHIFAEEGENSFRRLEAKLLDSLERMHSEFQTVVYATGGGLPVYNDNMRRLQELGTVITLEATIAVLVSRVKRAQNRPLLDIADDEQADNLLTKRLSELIAQRAPVYAQAGYKIDTSGLDPEQVADEIVRILSEANSNPAPR